MIEKGNGTMIELIKHIVFSLVDHPEKVKVDVARGTEVSVVELRVAKEDLGKVIGKQGRTAQAMRTILNAVSAKANKKTVLQILE
jgi:predicted RNA-binding protein YlqC (UPF0109 family)